MPGIAPTHTAIRRHLRKHKLGRDRLLADRQGNGNNSIAIGDIRHFTIDR